MSPNENEAAGGGILRHFMAVLGRAPHRRPARRGGIKVDRQGMMPGDGALDALGVRTIKAAALGVLDQGPIAQLPGRGYLEGVKAARGLSPISACMGQESQGPD